MGLSVDGDDGPGVVDPACVPDIFVEGIGLIERLAGNCLRITLYTNRDLGDGLIDRLVVARLVAPMCLVPNGMRQVIAAMLGAPFMSDAPASAIVPN